MIMNRPSVKFHLEITLCCYLSLTTQMLQSRRKKILDLYARACNVTEGKSLLHRREHPSHQALSSRIDFCQTAGAFYVFLVKMDSLYELC